MKKLTSGLVVCIHNKKEALIAQSAGANGIYYESFGDWKSDITQIKNIQQAIDVPIIHQIRTGHTVEARVFSHLKIDILDESAPFGDTTVDKKAFKSEFMAEAETFWEALEKTKEGYQYLRTKMKKNHSLEDTFSQLQNIQQEIQAIKALSHDKLVLMAQEKDIRLEILQRIKTNGFLPIRYFALVKNISIPDANLLKEVGADGLIVEHEIFKEETKPEEKLQKLKDGFEARSVLRLMELLEG